MENKFCIEMINKAILGPTKRIELGDTTVKVTGTRLNTFAQKGTTCICCGLEATHYEITRDRYGRGAHLNLMAGDILMTRDHIICHSDGGPDTVENMNPMCTTCNGLRGAIPDLEYFLELYRTSDHSNIEKVKKDLHDARSRAGNKKVHDERIASGNLTKKEKLQEMIKPYASSKEGIDFLEAYFNMSISKLWKREAAFNRAKSSGDELGATIIDILNQGGDRFRRDIGKWFRKNFLKDLTVSEQVQVDSRKSLGILMSKVRRHLDNPTAESDALLREYMKELRDAGNNVQQPKEMAA